LDKLTLSSGYFDNSFPLPEAELGWFLAYDHLVRKMNFYVALITEQNTKDM